MNIENQKGTPRENLLKLLLPLPLTGKSAGISFTVMSIDFALVGLNWLLLGALSTIVHTIVPQAHTLETLARVLSGTNLIGIALLHSALVVLHAHFEGLYGINLNAIEQRRALAKAIAWATALLIVAYRLQGAPASLIAMSCLAGILSFKSALLWTTSKNRREALIWRNRTRNVLIVGAGDIGRQLASYIDSHPETGREVCGFLDNDQKIGNRVLGRVGDLAQVARVAFIDEVILTASHDRELISGMLRETRKLRLDLEMVPDLFGCHLTSKEIEHIGDIPILCMHSEILPIAQLQLKRVIDIAGAGAALAFTAPLLALIMGLIRFDSTGPVIYAALRAGRKGRAFRCYKFRTMVSGADSLKNDLRMRNQRFGPSFKIATDPRITRVGYFLRRYSLDELPQLWNVLRGDMSLVGPRPHPLDDFAAYKTEHLDRLDVTPGITGLWQVTARREPSFQKGIELDRQYIRTWSLGGDLQILLKTVRAVVQGSGD